MQTPRMMFYLAEEAISALLEQIEGGVIIEKNTASSRELSKGLRTGAEAGGLFFQILNIGKMTLGTSRDTKESSADGGKHSVGPYSHLSMVVERLQPLLGVRYFESLDSAFGSAPDNEASWVQARDYFCLTNVGNEWSEEALIRERRFVFKINPNQESYDDGDLYYKKALRPWNLIMSASFENCPRLKDRIPGVSSHEALYFRRYNYSAIPLNIFGCYLKVGLHVQIIPFAIWI